MARITCDDCLDNFDNRYDLVLAAAERVKQLMNGFEESLIDEKAVEGDRGFRKDKETVVALREIAAGLVTPETLKVASAETEFEGTDLNLDSIINSFEEVDRQIEEEKRQAEEKEADR